MMDNRIGKKAFAAPKVSWILAAIVALWLGYVILCGVSINGWGWLGWLLFCALLAIMALVILLGVLCAVYGACSGALFGISAAARFVNTRRGAGAASGTRSQGAEAVPAAAPYGSGAELTSSPGL